MSESQELELDRVDCIFIRNMLVFVSPPCLVAYLCLVTACLNFSNCLLSAIMDKAREEFPHVSDHFAKAFDESRAK